MGRWAGIYNPSQISRTIANHLATQIFAGWAGGIFHPAAPAASHGTVITTRVLTITPPARTSPATLSPSHGVLAHPRLPLRRPGKASALRPERKIRTPVALVGGPRRTSPPVAIAGPGNTVGAELRAQQPRVPVCLRSTESHSSRLCLRRFPRFWWVRIIGKTRVEGRTCTSGPAQCQPVRLTSGVRV